MATNLVLINKPYLLNAQIGETFGGPFNVKPLENYGNSIAAASKIMEITEGAAMIDSSLTNSDSLNQINLVSYQPKKKNLAGYFAPPTIGWNLGVLHDYNAVDIANRCGTPIYAAAEGIIIPDKNNISIDDWNNGYGLFVLIEHPNSTQTRYAYLEKIAVSVGNYVNKGELIGFMGNTGNTHGPTGCHLHFEVIGAENPLAK